MNPTPQTPDDPQMHRSLQALPLHRAPDSLIPGVMAAIARRQKAWYRQPATSWPLPVQLAFAALSLIALGGALWIAVQALSAFQPVDLRTLLAAPLSRITALTATFDALLDAGALVGRVAIGPALLITVAAASVFYLILFGMGTALWRATHRITN